MAQDNHRRNPLPESEPVSDRPKHLGRARSGFTSKGRSTRGAIYEASITLIRKRGYESVTIPDICRECGISVGSFYHHFASKKDLLAAYVREESDRLFDFYRSRSGQNAAEALFSSLEEFLGYFSVKGPDFVSTFLANMISSRGAYFNPADFSLYRILVAGCRAAGDEGCLREDFTPDRVAELIAGLVWKLMVEWCTGIVEGDLKSAADERLRECRTLFFSGCSQPQS